MGVNVSEGAARSQEGCEDPVGCARHRSDIRCSQSPQFLSKHQAGHAMAALSTSGGVPNVPDYSQYSQSTPSTISAPSATISEQTPGWACPGCPQHLREIPNVPEYSWCVPSSGKHTETHPCCLSALSSPGPELKGPAQEILSCQKACFIQLDVWNGNLFRIKHQ